MRKTFIMLAALPFLCAPCLLHAQMPLAMDNRELHPGAPSVPEYVVFASDTVRFDRPDLYERMDRELITFTYTHTNSTLMLKRCLHELVDSLLRSICGREELRVHDDDVDVLVRSLICTGRNDSRAIERIISTYFLKDLRIDIHKHDILGGGSVDHSSCRICSSPERRVDLTIDELIEAFLYAQVIRSDVLLRIDAIGP